MGTAGAGSDTRGDGQSTGDRPRRGGPSARLSCAGQAAPSAHAACNPDAAASQLRPPLRHFLLRPQGCLRKRSAVLGLIVTSRVNALG